MFKNRNVGYSLVNRTQGTRTIFFFFLRARLLTTLRAGIAADSLRGRVFTTCLADLQQNDEDLAHRKIKLKCEDVSGKSLLTTFYGMDLTSDKLRSLVRKWQSLIEVQVDAKTTDGFTLRLFAIAFTKRRPNQVRSTTYAQSSQIRKIRKKMAAVIRREVSTCELKDLVVKFIPEAIGKQIEKECQSVFPLKDVYIRKVKTLRAPKFDAYRVAESHKETREDTGNVLAAEAGAGAAADPLGADQVPVAPVGDN